MVFFQNDHAKSCKKKTKNFRLPTLSEVPERLQFQVCVQQRLQPSEHQRVLEMFAYSVFAVTRFSVKMNKHHQAAAAATFLIPE